MTTPTSGKPPVILVVEGKEEKRKTLAADVSDLVGTKKYLVYSANFKSLANDPWQRETVLLVLGQKLPKNLLPRIESWVQSGGKVLDFEGDNLRPEDLSTLLENKFGIDLAEKTAELRCQPLDSLVSTINQFIRTLPAPDPPDAAGLSSMKTRDDQQAAPHVLVLGCKQPPEFDASRYKQALITRELGQVLFDIIQSGGFCL